MKGDDMFQINDLVISKQSLLPIDAERSRERRKQGQQITSIYPLQILEIQGRHGEERLTFKGVSGCYLAAFFESEL
jgi:hypothetical protein